MVISLGHAVNEYYLFVSTNLSSRVRLVTGVNTARSEIVHPILFAFGIAPAVAVVAIQPLQIVASIAEVLRVGVAAMEALSASHKGR
jgi:hypothetical protein